jgi:hypothetical protein
MQSLPLVPVSVKWMVEATTPTAAMAALPVAVN